MQYIILYYKEEVLDHDTGQSKEERSRDRHSTTHRKHCILYCRIAQSENTETVPRKLEIYFCRKRVSNVRTVFAVGRKDWSCVRWKQMQISTVVVSHTWRKLSAGSWLVGRLIDCWLLSSLVFQNYFSRLYIPMPCYVHTTRLVVVETATRCFLHTYSSRNTDITTYCFLLYNVCTT